MEDVRAILKVSWSPPTTDPFESISDEGLEIDMSDEDSMTFHHVGRAGIKIDLTTLGMNPVIVPRGGAGDLFVARWQGTAQVFTDFTAFVDELNDIFNDDTPVARVFAVGEFDDATAVMTADYIEVQYRPVL